MKLRLSAFLLCTVLLLNLLTAVGSHAHAATSTVTGDSGISYSLSAPAEPDGTWTVNYFSIMTREPWQIVSGTRYRVDFDTTVTPLDEVYGYSVLYIPVDEAVALGWQNEWEWEGNWFPVTYKHFMKGTAITLDELIKFEDIDIEPFQLADKVSKILLVLQVPRDGWDEDFERSFLDTVAFYAEKPILSSTPGDANGDGLVNARDIALLQRYVAKWNVDIDLTAADVNKDGAVNAKDVALVQRFVAGWSIELQ